MHNHKSHKTHNAPRRHRHEYYESVSNIHRRPSAGGIVFCKNDDDCMHILEPAAMQIFRQIIASGKQPIIRTYPRTLANGRQLCAIYPKPDKLSPLQKEVIRGK